jgi:hypothetical protein
MSRGRGARAEAQRRGEEELDVNGFVYWGKRDRKRRTEFRSFGRGRGRGRRVRGYLLEVIGEEGMNMEH